MLRDALSVNFILYSREWVSTVGFYRDGLGLPIIMANDWFVEFRLGPDSRLSVADECRASIKCAGGAGLTIAIEVADIDAVWAAAQARGLEPTAIGDHPWDARVFHLADPEGRRLEVWQKA